LILFDQRRYYLGIKQHTEEREMNAAKMCDCNQGRLTCSCATVRQIDYSNMNPTERLAFCRGDDPVSAVIADDAAARQPLRAPVTPQQRRHDDNAEAAELQSWLVGNARAIRPGNTTGLMAWALAALRAQSDQLLEAASAPERVRADVAVADCNDAERREVALLERVAELETALGGMLFAFDDGVGRDWSAPLLDHARKLCKAIEFQPAPAADGGAV
jgi:hypothetical protein